MYILTEWILDVSNDLQNTQVTINERVYVIPPPYYLYCFEKSYPNVPLNRGESPFCLQFMNGTQGTKSSQGQRNWILDTVFTMLKYKKITIDHVIYIRVLYDGIISYLNVYYYYVINTTNGDT